MAKGLTDKQVENVSASSTRLELPDGKMPNLYLVVQPSGVKSWAFRYRFDGRPRKHTIGRYPGIGLKSARVRCQTLHLMLAEGKDPGAEKAAEIRAAKEAENEARKRKSDLFEDVVDEFIEKYAKLNHKRWQDTKNKLDRYFMPRWRGRDIHDIRKTDVIDVLDDLVESGMGVGVNRALAVIRKFFNWLVSRGRLDLSPAYKVQPPVPENSRDRVLSDYEIKLYWLAATEMGYPYGDFYKLLLLTMQRKSEVAEAPWSEFDIDLWNLPASRSKNKRASKLRLPQPILDVMNGLPRMGRYLFTSSVGTPISAFSDAKQILDEKMLEIARKEAVEDGHNPNWVRIPHFTNHDIRRSGSTKMGKLGVPPHVVEAILNHKSGTVSGVAAVYNRFEYEDEKFDALNRWARHVKSLADFNIRIGIWHEPPPDEDTDEAEAA